MLKNKIAVITGAGAGIGEATARIFDREGIEGIAIVDYNYEAACRVAESLGEKAMAVKCDIPRPIRWKLPHSRSWSASAGWIFW